MEAYILAGGKSSRMGEDKGLKLLNGKPMIQYVIETISPYFSGIKINTGNTKYADLGYELIPDSIPEKGPMGGIYTALKNSSDSEVFIISCDMPFITPAVVNYLLDQPRNNNAIVASYNHEIQPLFGIYNQKIFPLIEEKINKNQLKMMDFLQEIQAEIVEMNEIEKNLVFLNINTIEEFKNIENK